MERLRDKLYQNIQYAASMVLNLLLASEVKQKLHVPKVLSPTFKQQQLFLPIVSKFLSTI